MHYIYLHIQGNIDSGLNGLLIFIKKEMPKLFF